MAETFVAVLPSTDVTAKKIRNVSNVIGPDTVLQQVVSQALSDGTLIDPRAIRALSGATDTVAIAGTVPVSAVALPLPSGAAGEHVTAASFHAARLTDGAAFYKPTTPTDTQPVSIAATVAVSGPLTDAQLAARLPLSIRALVPTDVVSINGTVPISAVALPLPVGAATEATLATRAADATFTAAIGAATVDAPAASTVLDRLAQIKKSVDALAKEERATTAAVRMLVPVVPARTTTLLHRF